ncbi:MAG TPA: glycerophosphodiester phosphodiesterase family protein [Kiritimatiellia bacterium]|nr:glycerophosphodiester phosphodiesterase family protein [Kiritimatiellia bacterium]
MKTTIMVLVCAAAFAAPALQWEKPAPVPREKGLFRSQIHRGGGRAARPDNALETFLWCWGLGFAPEADARLTKDGVAVAMHDDTFKRIGRGITPEFAARKVNDLTWAEIRDVDTGSYLGKGYATTRVATMETVFAAMRGRPERLLYVDEKGAPPELIAKLAEQFGVIGQTYYCSSNWRKVVAWRKVAPKGRSMVWLGNFPKNNSPESVAKTEAFVQQRFDEMAATGFDGIDQVQIHVRTDLTRPDPFCPSSAFIRRAIELLHKHGVSVNGVTWTEGENADVHRKLWDLGFDHFTSDYPVFFSEFTKTIRKD